MFNGSLCNIFEQKMVEIVLEFKYRRNLYRRHGYLSWKMAQHTVLHAFVVLQGALWEF